MNIVQPITWVEIEAWERGNLHKLTVWQRRLIRRADDKVRGIVNSRAGGGQDRISVKDGRGVMGLFRNLISKKGGKPK